jgi:hypothetical protein
MKFNLKQYTQMLADYHISVFYSGPIWAGGIDGMAGMLQRRLDFDDLPLSTSQSVFSVFVEQMNNMLMYSAEKECFEHYDGNHKETSKGVFVLGIQNKTYFIQAGNIVTNNNAEILKSRIDYLNTLDKKELRQHYKERLKSGDDNLESKGAGLGLIEIARRATSGIEYEFTPHGDGLSYFTLYVTI